MTVEHSYRTYKEEPVEHKPYIVYSEDENTDIRKVIADVNEEIITNAVDDWLDDHPEATTTVQDGSISVAKLAADTVSLIDSKASADAYAPLLTAGIADSLLSTDEQTATFAQRVSEGASVGVRAILGNTVVWNQQFYNGNFENTTDINKSNCTISAANNELTATGTSDSTPYINHAQTIIGGRKYYATIDVYPSEVMTALACTGIHTTRFENIPANTWRKCAYIATADENNSEVTIYFNYNNANNGMVTKFRNAMLFDLTLMFGAGNEPATVEEFEALYPESYYPYDAGSLLPVNVEGVKAVGFNQWDEQWEVGGISSTTGENTESSVYFRSKNYIPISGASYFFRTDTTNVVGMRFYDSSKTFLNSSAINTNNIINISQLSPNAAFFRFVNTSLNAYRYDTCINISNPALNGTYRPYTEHTHEIPASTYFPDGLRGAGTAHDELHKDKAITRIGAVDLGSLTWTKTADSRLDVGYYFSASGLIPSIASGTLNRRCAAYEMCPIPGLGNIINQYGSSVNKVMYGTTNSDVYIIDSAYTDAAAFKTAMSGVYLFYELATPTTTEIDPPLNMDYQTEHGGVESIVIPTGEMSAPMTLVYVQGYDANGVADRALSVIAPLEGAKASTNYAIGSYFIQAGKLYKVTSAIATGEDITPGTNCTETTVMAEILAIE